MNDEPDPPWWAIAVWLAGMIVMLFVLPLACQPSKPWGIGD